MLVPTPTVRYGNLMIGGRYFYVKMLFRKNMTISILNIFPLGARIPLIYWEVRSCL